VKPDPNVPLCDPGYLAELQKAIRESEQRIRSPAMFPPLALVCPPSEGGHTENTGNAEYTENGQEPPPGSCVLCVAPQDDPFLAAILTTAQQHPAVEARMYITPGMQTLVSICWTLQLAAGSRPFYLSCRAAGWMIGVDHSRAARFLRKLCHDKLLTVVSVGTMASGYASQYRYNASKVEE
jgi:hypothetical protein